MTEEYDYSNYRVYEQLYTLYKGFLTIKECKNLYKKLKLNHKRIKRHYNERRNKRTKS